MMDFVMFAVAIMALCGAALCLLGIYDIILEHHRKRKQKKTIEEWQRRLP